MPKKNDKNSAEELVIQFLKKNKDLLAKRIDNTKNYWQMTQGDVKEGEEFYHAALRMSLKHI